jgi:hypothetical protein
LASVVQEPDFNPDEMGDYMRLITKVDETPKGAVLSREIDRLVTSAWAEDFLKYTRGTHGILAAP